MMRILLLLFISLLGIHSCKASLSIAYVALPGERPLSGSLFASVADFFRPILARDSHASRAGADGELAERSVAIFRKSLARSCEEALKRGMANKTNSGGSSVVANQCA